METFCREHMQRNHVHGGKGLAFDSSGKGTAAMLSLSLQMLATQDVSTNVCKFGTEASPSSDLLRAASQEDFYAVLLPLFAP